MVVLAGVAADLGVEGAEMEEEGAPSDRGSPVAWEGLIPMRDIQTSTTGICLLY